MTIDCLPTPSQRHCWSSLLHVLNLLLMLVVPLCLACRFALGYCHLSGVQSYLSAIQHAMAWLMPKV